MGEAGEGIAKPLRFLIGRGGHGDGRGPLRGVPRCEVRSWCRIDNLEPFFALDVEGLRVFSVLLWQIYAAAHRYAVLRGTGPCGDAGGRRIGEFRAAAAQEDVGKRSHQLRTFGGVRGLRRGRWQRNRLLSSGREDVFGPKDHGQHHCDGNPE